MHLQIRNFLDRFVRESGVRTLSGRRVVEIGSYDLNDSAREVLQPGTASYVGVDWREGPGVDVVSLGHARCCQRHDCGDHFLVEQFLEVHHSP